MDDQLPSAILLKGGTILQHGSDDKIAILKATDLLVEKDTIVQIGKDLVAQPDTLVIDCHNAIVSPGFVDTHHHVWQTQLKGRHSDDTLLDYTAKGKVSQIEYSSHESLSSIISNCSFCVF